VKQPHMTDDLERGAPQGADDRLLLSRIALRDREAFETLYRRYYSRAFHFVMRVVRNESAAEEVVSDTMFAVWQSAASFEGASSVSTWLLGIAYRQALKSLDRNRKHERVDADDERVAETVDSDPSADPEAAAISDSESELLQRGLESLSGQHRVVLELTATGHSSVEISEIIDCSENTVRTRMFHARQQLKRFLGRAAGGALLRSRAASHAARGRPLDSNSADATAFMSPV
jgi:RNA polymerase sigma-70 factor, ECF subfamily